MKMNSLMESWRGFVNETSSTRVYKRIILNELQVVTEEQLKEFPLSKEELEEIKEWGELEGDPMLLGTGTMGSAYQFGDKVLKITLDEAEAKAAYKIAGKFHPNVYRVLKVAKRSGKYPEDKLRPFIIVYELVAYPNDGGELPDEQLQDVVKSIYNSKENIKYFWVDNFPEVMKKFEDALEKNVDKLVVPELRYASNEPLIDSILKDSDMSSKEAQAFKFAWGIVAGFYGKCFHSLENAKECLNNKKFEYVNKIASGLSFLMEHGIRFMDLKTTNVMQVDEEPIIIDIGKSAVMGYVDIPKIS